MAKKQREIGVAEFFAKNRHLLGFDNKRKALLTTIKEAVDNSLDACEEAKILPEINVEMIDMGNERFRVIIEDNGPGIVKEQIPKIFAKLLYGSKFHRLKQSLTGDEPILIKQDNRIKIIPIGDIIDKYIKDEEDMLCNELDIRVPCFDWKEYKYTFKKVSHLIKHKRENEIYNISTMYGKHIKVTGCHSLFTINKNTLNIEEVQARELKKGDIVLAPKKLDVDDNKNEINILDYIEENYARKRYWYVYTRKEIIKDIFSNSKIIHKKKQGNRSRKYYRFLNNKKIVDIVDDSYKQYASKGFIPLWLVKFLDLKINNGMIKTYFHGKEYNVPIIWSLTNSLMKLIGLFVAEGHTGNRQIGFTFSRKERDLVKLVCDTGFTLGTSYTVEERPEKNCIRVKLFGGILSYLFKKWCGRGAKNKKLPDFIFSASAELRQDCLDYLYRGDGHNAKNKNQLMLTTVSKELANQIMYLWLIQGVIASCSERMNHGFGKTPSKCYIISVYGKNINDSNYYNSNIITKRRRCDVSVRILLKMLGNKQTAEVLRYMETLKKLSYKQEYSKIEINDLFNTDKIGYKLRYMLDNDYLAENNNSEYCVTQKTMQLCRQIQKLNTLIKSDLIFLPIKKIKVINEGYDFVYDISVPENENFVGGFGAIACHNSRGQQGIGISASVMYGQLTTGKPAKIVSKIRPKEPAHYYELHIDTQKNSPEIVKEASMDWDKEHGTRIEIDLEGSYQKGTQSVDQYLKQTAIVNPHVTIIYTTPKAEQIIFPRATEDMPAESKEIKPHPYGVELGVLIRMLKITQFKTLQQFLTSEFSRVGSGTAKQICESARIPPNTKTSKISREMADTLIKGIKETKIIAPPSDCISPIGAEHLEKGLKKEINAEYYCSVTRPPNVYRGNPFIIEAAIAYGGEQDKEGQINILRYANRVPLLFQQGACAVTKSAQQTNWRGYGLSQSTGGIPLGPVTLVVHMASVWVPFTSESKEAIAHYPEIIKEIKLAVQECGRKLGSYLAKKKKIGDEFKKRSYIEIYIPHVAEALKELIGINEKQVEEIELKLHETLEKSRGKIDKVGFDKTKNTEYDEEFAKIGKEVIKEAKEEIEELKGKKVEEQEKL
ncbi:MAG: DNA topoisomerase VI subunit B [Candidatus Woesearchaeota archaeon]